VTPPCQHSRRQYRSKNRCGLSCRPLIKDSTSARMNSAPFGKSYRGGTDTIIKDRSARWPVPGTKRETLPLSLPLSPLLFSSCLFFRTCSSSLIDLSLFLQDEQSSTVLMRLHSIEHMRLRVLI